MITNKSDSHEWLQIKMILTNKSDSHKRLQIKLMVTNDYKFSSNATEVIRPILNFLLLFFYKKVLHTPKAKNRL